MSPHADSTDSDRSRESWTDSIRPCMCSVILRTRTHMHIHANNGDAEYASYARNFSKPVADLKRVRCYQKYKRKKSGHPYVKSPFHTKRTQPTVEDTRVHVYIIVFRDHNPLLSRLHQINIWKYDAYPHKRNNTTHGLKDTVC